MSREAEYEAAYFTLLRAREEHADLLRYREFLGQEQHRLTAFADETRAREDDVPRKLRRPVSLTTKPLLEAAGRRRTVVEDEWRRVDERIEAAQAFVEECEAEVSLLRE